MNFDPQYLPTTLPLLPLGPFVLLPETSLPITLTDPQSLGILEAALASGGWVGVIQPLDGQGEGPEQAERFYPVGCLGHAVDLGRDEEGRRILLEGMIRFRVRRELPPAEDGIPRAEVAYEEFARDLAGEAEPVDWNLDAIKEQIVEFGRRNFGSAGILETLSPRQVVLFMAQTAPFTPAEKQALLEAPGLRELVDLLTRLLSLNYLTTTPDGSPSVN